MRTTITVNLRPGRPSATYLLDGVDRTSELFQIDLATHTARGFLQQDKKKLVLRIGGHITPMTFTRHYRSLRIIDKVTHEDIDPLTIVDTLPINPKQEVVCIPSLPSSH